MKAGRINCDICGQPGQEGVPYFFGLINRRGLEKNKQQLRDKL